MQSPEKENKNISTFTKLPKPNADDIARSGKFDYFDHLIKNSQFNLTQMRIFTLQISKNHFQEQHFQRGCLEKGADYRRFSRGLPY